MGISNLTATAARFAAFHNSSVPTAAMLTPAAPAPIATTQNESRAYTDPSNCRKAMLKAAAAAGASAEDFKVTKHGDRDFRFARLTSVLKTEVINDGIPEFLKISPEARKQAWIDNPPKRTTAPASSKENEMAKKAAAPAKAAKPKKDGGRSRYDWAGAEAMADKGKVPPALDFSAPTHARFRDALKEVVAAAKAGDEKALKAVKINPVSSSPKALDRYRGLCVKAVKAAA